MTPSELKASNDQLRNWNADYRRQIAELKANHGQMVNTILERGAQIKRVRDIKPIMVKEINGPMVFGAINRIDVLKALEKIE
jgi:hypothetical protein